MRDKFVFIPSTDNKLHGVRPMSRSELDRRELLIGRVTNVFGASKAEAKRKANEATQTMQHDIGPAPDKHAVLWNYEKGHLAGGESWSATAAALKGLLDSQNRREVMVHEFAHAVKEIGGTAQIEGVLDWKGGSPTYVKLGTVFIGDARFVKLHPQPGGLTNPVYVLGRVIDGTLKQDPEHTKAHFVWVPNSQTYVRRFVTRGLNYSDIINIEARHPLGSPLRVATAHQGELRSTKNTTRHDGPAVDDALTEQQQILSHTRGWQKRYISTGVSNRPVYSTRGTQFMSLYGTAVIDLAKVDLRTVWDIHSPAAVENVMKWSSDNVVTATGPGNGATTFKGEEFLALRDVLRTRELLIKFQVPVTALNCNVEGRLIVGFGTDKYEHPGNVASALQSSTHAPHIVMYDPLRFKDPGTGKYWLFVLCDSVIEATNVHGFTHAFVKDKKHLLRYQMPNAIVGWKV